MLLSLAIRSMRRNRRRSAVTLAAITAGVAVTVFVHGFGEGMINMLIKNTVEMRTGAIQVRRAGYSKAQETAPLKLDMEVTPELLHAIESTVGVRAASPRIRFGALLSNGTTSSVVMAEAFDPAREMKVCSDRALEVKEGTHVSTQVGASARGAALGAELAKGMKAKVGSSLTLQAAGREGGVNALDVDVAGILRGAAVFESKRTMNVPLTYAEELLGMPGRATEIAVAVDDLSQVAHIEEELRRRLGPQYEVEAWDEVMPFLRDATARIRIVLRGVSAVLFFIVVFGVVNTMLMNVYERVREIGTMLALGVRRRQVMQLFLIEAAVLGVFGGILGALFGYGFTWAVGQLGISVTPPGSFAQIIRPVPIAPVAVLALVAAALGASAAAAYPARKAAQQNPVDALRAT